MPIFNQDGTITIRNTVNAGNLVYYILAFERKREWFKLHHKTQLFSYLLKKGWIWHWRKIYQKTAKALIKSKLLKKDGTILKKASKYYDDRNIDLRL